MSAQKQFWFYRSGIANTKFASDPIHSTQSCTSCHGGVDGTPDKAAAHAGMTAAPGSSACLGCHDQDVSLANGSMHTRLEGYETILSGRGVDFTAGTQSRIRFDAQCTRCHAAVSSTEAACGQCHIAVPAVASSGAGQLVAGHRMSKTPDTANNCSACHGSRVRNEYFGENDALYKRNRQYSASLVATDGFGGTTLQPDVHRTNGMGCDACHPASEMHGAGVAPAIDRYGIAGRVQCETCHASLVGSNAFHTSGHLSSMACQLCHAQPYKNCFGCHTQMSATSGAYFTSNATDPTWTDRVTAFVNAPQPAAWSSATTYAGSALVSYNAVQYKSLWAGNLNHQPDTNPSWWQAVLAPGPDALMTFRAGQNPKYGIATGAKKYAVLRHPPVDADVFTYTDEGGAVPGLIPDLTALPTWKYATPHNILRNTAITTDPDGAGPLTACGNCHSSRYGLFWLTDAQSDAQGWSGGAAFETDANAGVVQPAPIAPSIP